MDEATGASSTPPEGTARGKQEPVPVEVSEPVTSSSHPTEAVVNTPGPTKETPAANGCPSESVRKLLCEVEEAVSKCAVPLPAKLPDLVRSYERVYLQCEEMRAILDSLRMEANHLAATSPSAGSALGDLLAVVGDGEGLHPAAGGGATHSTPPRTRTDVNTPSPVRTTLTAPTTPVPGSPTDRAVPSPGASPAVVPPVSAVVAGRRSAGSGVVSGKVITGRVVSPMQGSTGAVAGGAVEDGSTGSVGRLSRFVEDFRRDYKEEYSVLKTQMMAMEASQQLLAAARSQLQEMAREKRVLEAEVERLKGELTKTVDLGESLDETAGEESVGGGASSSAAVIQLNRARAEACQLAETVRSLSTACEAAVYAEQQVVRNAAETTKKMSFLEETNAQLEGQLQRLLSVPQQMDSPLESSLRPPRGGGAAGKSPSAAATNNNGTGDAGHERGAGSQRPQAATGSQGATPQRVTADAYNRAGAEKQIEELRAMVEKMQKRIESNTEKRRKLEATVAELTRENGELKASVLQYRRQVNESELDMEREASVQVDSVRVANMEKEIYRLRTALRDRKDNLVARCETLSEQVETLSREKAVYKTSTAHLQRELLKYQLKFVILTHKTESRNEGRDKGATPAKQGAGHRGKTAEVHSSKHLTEGGGKRPGSASAEASSGHPATPTPVAATASVAGHGSVVTEHREASIPASSPVTTNNVSFGSPNTAQHNKEALEEMRFLYERRMETLEAQKRAEVRQVQSLNKELRQALVASQEEVQEKTRLLDLARAQSSNPLLSAPGATYGSVRFSSDGLNSRSGDTPTMPRATSSRASLIGGTPRSVPVLSTLVPETDHQRRFSRDSVTSPGDTWRPSRTLSEIEQDYDPEHMSVADAVQLENEALLRRVFTLQEEKWGADNVIEDLQRQLGVLQRELQRNAETMNQLLKAGVVSPAAMQKGHEEGRLRSLQIMLQETLSQKISLEEEVARLTERLSQYH